MESEPARGYGRIPTDSWVAGQFATALLTAAEWVHRRVETVTFTDAATVQRRTSMDFSVPDYMPQIGAGTAQLTLVPLAYLAKGPIKTLDVRDATGGAVSVLTTEENAQWAVQALQALAVEYLLAESLPIGDDGPDGIAEIQGPLDRVVRDRPPEARAAYDELRSTLHEHRRAGRPLGRLADAGPFLEIVETLVDNFLLVALCGSAPRHGAILKFSYIEPAGGGHDERTRRERIFDELGITPQTIVLDLPGANLASSYHIEIRMPDGVGITEAVLFGATSDEDMIARSDRRGQPTVHLRAPRRPGPTCQVKANLRASAGGWLRASTFSVTAVAVLLTMSAFRLDVLEPATGAAGARSAGDVAALLLAFVGVLGALVVRQGEHALTAQLLIWARGATMAAVALPFVGAWFLVFGPQGTALRILWFALAVTSIAWACLLWRIYRGPKLVMERE